MEPGRTFDSTVFTICFAVIPLRQSCGSTDHSTTRIPSSFARSITSGEYEPPGGRNRCVCAPAAVIASAALEISPLITVVRSEEHTSELQSHSDLVCRL